MAYYFSGTDDQSKLAVWAKGQVIPGYDPRIWRRDVIGNAMRYSDHGEITEYGWEIDHIKPVAKGGASVLSNLQPLKWEANRAKGDQYPWLQQKVL